MVYLLIQPNSLLSDSCSSVPSFVVSLPSVLTSRLATPVSSTGQALPLANGSGRYSCASGTFTLWVIQINELYLPFKAHTMAISNCLFSPTSENPRGFSV